MSDESNAHDVALGFMAAADHSVRLGIHVTGLALVAALTLALFYTVHTGLIWGRESPSSWSCWRSPRSVCTWCSSCS